MPAFSVRKREQHEREGWPPTSNNTQQWGDHERARPNQQSQRNGYDGTTQSEFERGGQERAPQQSDAELFQYAEQRSISQQEMRPTESPMPPQGFSFPASTNKSKAKDSVLRQQGQSFIQKHQKGVRLKKQFEEKPQSRIDINGQKDFQPKHWRRPKVEVAACVSNIDISGKYPAPKAKRPALMQVGPPVHDTDIFCVQSHPEAHTRHSLMPSKHGYDKTSGIFSNPTGYREERRTVMRNVRHQPLSEMLHST